MPKNTGPGGKKFKKIKHNLVSNTRQLELAEDGQKYALVKKLLGNGRTSVIFINDNNVGVERLARIRGTLRKKKQWVKPGNFILISVREFEDEKVDIIHVYNDMEMNELKRKDYLPKELIKISNNTNSIKTDKSGKVNSSSIKDDDEFSEFIDYEVDEQTNKYEIKQKQVRGNNISIQDFGIPDSEESEDDSNSLES